MPLELNTGHAAYADLQTVWTFKEGSGNPLEFISSDAGALTGSATWDTEGSGIGITVPSGSSVTLGVDRFPAGRNCTIVYRGRRISAAGDQSRFGTAGTSTSGIVGTLMPYGDGNVYFYWGGGTDNISRLVVPSLSFDTTLDTFVFRISSTEIRAWRNGTLIGFTTGGAPPSRPNDGTQVRIGGFDFFAGLNQFVDLFAIYDSGVLSDSVCADLSADPWDIFLVTVSGERTPTTGTLTLTGITPGVRSPVTPLAGSLAFTGYSPRGGELQSVAGSLTLVGYAPTLAVSGENMLGLQWAVLHPADILLGFQWVVLPQVVSGATLGLTWTVIAEAPPLGFTWEVMPEEIFDLFESAGVGAAAGIGEDILLPVGRVTRE